MHDTNEGIRKAALFLKGLPENAVETVLKKFDAETAVKIRLEMEKPADAPGDRLQKTVAEFLDAVASPGNSVAQSERAVAVSSLPTHRQHRSCGIYRNPTEKKRTTRATEEMTSGTSIFDEEMNSADARELVSRDTEEFAGGIDALLCTEESSRPDTENTISGSQNESLPSRFVFLAEHDAKTVFRVLAGEHPGVIVVVLTHLPETLAAEVLERFDPSVSKEIVTRLLQLEEIDPEVLDEIEAAIGERCEGIPVTKRKNIGKPFARKILRVLSAEFRDSLFARNERGVIYERFSDSTEPRDDETGASAFIKPGRVSGKDETKKRNLLFDDLEHLPERALFELFSGVDARTALTALIGAPRGLIDRVTKNCSPDEEIRLRTELGAMLPVHPDEVAAARRRILASVSSCN